MTFGYCDSVLGYLSLSPLRLLSPSRLKPLKLWAKLNLCSFVFFRCFGTVVKADNIRPTDFMLNRWEASLSEFRVSHSLIIMPLVSTNCNAIIIKTTEGHLRRYCTLKTDQFCTVLHTLLYLVITNHELDTTEIPLYR